MTTHKIKGYIVHQVWADSPNGPAEIKFHGYKPSPPGENALWIDTLVREETITVEIPDDFDPRPNQVEALREAQTKLRAEMSARIKELDDRINSLLAIEMA